jgi:ABC-2 type transport system permease protein
MFFPRITALFNINNVPIDTPINASLIPKMSEEITQIENKTENFSKNQIQSFFYAYVMIFALYIVILLYGRMIATNVVTEKSTHVMEILITSTKTTSMMFGKIIASCLAGLTQLVSVFSSTIVFYKLNQSYWNDNIVINSIFNMPYKLSAYFLVFFILGFFIYAFIFASVGSTTSKLEDVNTAVIPIMILFIIAFVIIITSISSGNVDTTLMIVFSYIPFTSPMSMLARIAMSTVPWYEIAISMVILISSTIGIGALSAKIYRVGVQLYGVTPKFRNIIKAIYKYKY